MFIQCLAVNKRFSCLTGVLVCLFLLAQSGPASAFDTVAMPHDTVTLTAAERAYINEHKSVTLCVDPDWVPYERIDASGKHVGIAADLLALVSARTGIEFELVPTRDWNESLEFSRSGRCKVLSFLNQTSERSEWLIFTTPLFSDPNVFITREEHPFISDPATLENESIVFPEGTAMEGMIRERYPNLEIKLVNSEDEALDMVSARRSSMTMRSLIVAAYTIRKNGLFNLKIAGQLPMYINHLRIGVKKGDGVLRNILDKGVQSITPQEKGRVVNQHVTINVQTMVDPRWLFMGGGLAVTIAALWGYWTYRLRKLNAALLHLSNTDSLTGLANRQKLSACMAETMIRSYQHDLPFSVMLFDLDNFKRVNDTFGHLAGDAVLQALNSIASNALRPQDTPGRWGGEEFLVLLPETAAGEATTLAEILRKGVGEYEFSDGLHCTISIGVAQMRSDDTPDTLIHRADTALYRAKKEGKNRVVLG
ncbi:diguanylate cyclase [Desulfovibrio sp.]|uniref:diguanylate cyclase n=1 Tax=Desulfovibrio sp. TaxID=885 RepID=UPI0025BEAA5C|nr:diguanylate cyclase [Desulfovibrio sp.]